MVVMVPLRLQECHGVSVGIVGRCPQTWRQSAVVRSQPTVSSDHPLSPCTVLMLEFFTYTETTERTSPCCIARDPEDDNREYLLSIGSMVQKVESGGRYSSLAAVYGGSGMETRTLFHQRSRVRSAPAE